MTESDIGLIVPAPQVRSRERRGAGAHPEQPALASSRSGGRYSDMLAARQACRRRSRTHGLAKGGTLEPRARGWTKGALDARETLRWWSVVLNLQRSPPRDVRAVRRGRLGHSDDRPRDGAVARLRVCRDDVTRRGRASHRSAKRLEPRWPDDPGRQGDAARGGTAGRLRRATIWRRAPWGRASERLRPAAAPSGRGLPATAYQHRPSRRWPQ